MTRIARQLGWMVQPALVVLVVWYALGGTDFRFDTPLMFTGEALYFLAQAKATIDHGWWWTNPSLGAPFSLHAVLLPWGANVDHVIIRLAAFVSQDVATVVMFSWLAMIGLSAVTAAWCLRHLGVSHAGAWVSGALFALMPYAAYHNTIRFNLTIYLIPFGAAAAMRLATDEIVDWRLRGMRVLAVGAFVLCLNTVDYAVFGIAVVALGAVAGAAFRRTMRPIGAGAVLAALMVVAMVIIATPRWSAWSRRGEPDGLRDRPVTVEMHGLKIRHLVSPLPDHWFPPLRHWAAMQSEAGFLLEGRNAGSRIGLVASLGLLGAIAVVLVPSLAGDGRRSEVVLVTSRLALGSVLLATIGGFGSVLAVLGLISPGLLTNMAPFIAFFVLAVVALTIDRLQSRHRLAVWSAVLALGVADQAIAFAPLTASANGIRTDIRELRRVVERLEHAHPARAQVFQLPLRPYPREDRVWHMGLYDQFRPYLVSRGSRWSYPALSEAQLAWQNGVSGVDPRELPARLARAGFTSILIDRWGYEDNADALIAGLEAIPNAAVIVSGTDRYVALDLRFALDPR